MAEQEAIGLLEQLARDFNVRDPRKLQQIARREFPDRRDLTAERARTALRSDVARQVLAPKPRSLGKSAAEGPDQRLQADLVDFSQNTRGPNRYGLVVTDVFTREVATKALPNKQSGTVTQAAAEIIPELVQGEGSYVVTTDQGNEFRGLEGALPEPAVHREKLPSDRNATAVIDRAIQTLKKDLAGKVARDGGGWAEHVAEVTEAYNARPHQAVTVAPEDVDLPGAPGQRGEVRAQQEPDGGPAAPAGGGRGLPGPDERGEELPAPVRGGAGGGGLRLDDGAGHRRLGDPAQARAARAQGIGRAEGTAHEAARAAGRPAAAGLQPGTRGTALTGSVEKLQNQNPSKNCRAPEPA